MNPGSKVGKQIRQRRSKTSTSKNRDGPKLSHRRGSPSAGQETEVTRLTRELAEALEQLTATGEILQVINRSPGDLAPVFDTILQKAHRLCGVAQGSLHLYDGEVFRAVAVHGISEAFADRLRQGFRPGPMHPARPLLEGARFAQIADCAEADDPIARSAFDISGIRTALFIPLRKNQTHLGQIVAARREVKPFAEKEIALLESFAAQAVVAMENARLLTDQRAALEQQTAVGDVLKVISRSTFDLQGVLDTLVATAARLCDTDMAFILRRDGDVFRAGAHVGFTPEFEEFLRAHPIGIDRGSTTGRVALEKRIVHILDTAADPEYRLTQATTLSGQRTTLGVPLLRDGEVIGVIVLARRRVEPFSHKHIELVTTFADQAVIAMENARLMTETREALEQQTATAEVLGVINSSPGDLTPVFDAILEKAMQLCDVGFGILRIYDGARFHTAAACGVPPTYAEFLARNPQDPRPGTIGARILGGEMLVHVVDAKDDEVYRSGETGRRALVDLGGARTSLVVPLTTDRGVVGVIQFYRQEVRPFTEKQIALLQNFAAQAVIAMENARLLMETREALEQQTATAEVLGVINSSPGNLAPVFDAMLERATRVCDADAGVLATYDGNAFHLQALYGLSITLEQFPRGPIRPHPEQGIGRIAAGEEIAHILDSAAGDAYESGAPGRRAIVDLGGARTQLTAALRKDGVLLGSFTLWRCEVRAFSEKQIALLKNFAAQAVIAMENARLMTETREALEKQTATAEVLRVISGSATDVQPVFEAIVAHAAKLCEAEFSAVARLENDLLLLVAVSNLAPDEAEVYSSLFPRPLSRGFVMGRAFLEGRTVHVEDVLADPDYDPQLRETFQSLMGNRTFLFRSFLAVPILRDGKPIGVIGCGRRAVRPFTPAQTELVTTFADQAVIAIENARLFEELRERTTDLARSVDELTATGDVLKIISRSSIDLETVLDTLAETAARLCRADQAVMFRFRDDLYRLVASNGLSQEAEEFVRMHPFPPGPGTLSGRVTLKRRAVHIADVLQDSEYTNLEHQKILGFRTMLGVPLLREDVLVGIFTIHRTRVEAFTTKEIALVTSFADQAVIAIENARLFDELRERQAELARSVDELTATGDVLKIISRSSVDLETVLDTLVETVARLCRVDHAVMLRRGDDQYHMVASRGYSEEAQEFVRTHPVAVNRGTVSGRVELERRAVHIPDVLQDPEYTYWGGQKIAGFRTMLGVPLLRQETLVGILLLNRTRVEPFTSKEIELATTFADQAVIAIENARLFDELRERQAELRVTFDNMGDGVVMFDAAARLTAWNRNFQELLDFPDAFLAGRPSYAEYFRYLAERGEYSSDLEAQLSRTIEDTSREMRVERTRPDGRVIEVRRNPVPGGGFVLIYADITERKRAEEAIRAARDAAETALRELKAAQASLVHAQKMAALGQLTAGIAHEIKNPLNFVNNFAGLSVELLDELKEVAAQAMGAIDVDKRAEFVETFEMLTSNLEKIAEHGRRADGIVRSMLQHSRGSSGNWQASDLNTLLEEALNLAYHGARAQDQSFNITLERDFDRSLAQIEVVPQDLMRVFLNLIGNGFYATGKRQREWGEANFRPALKVTMRDHGNVVEVRIRDNGTGIPPEIKDKLFQPFFTTKPTGEGTGLGLSISYDIVTQQHGGTIAVDTAPGEFTEFTVRLPRGARPKPGATEP
jgi:PAS domain S-box-containing protein